MSIDMAKFAAALDEARRIDLHDDSRQTYLAQKVIDAILDLQQFLYEEN